MNLPEANDQNRDLEEFIVDDLDELDLVDLDLAYNSILADVEMDDDLELDLDDEDWLDYVESYDDIAIDFE